MHGLGQNLDSVCECSVLQASGSGETLFQFRYVFVLYLQETLHRKLHSRVRRRYVYANLMRNIHIDTSDQ